MPVAVILYDTYGSRPAVNAFTNGSGDYAQL